MRLQFVCVLTFICHWCQTAKILAILPSITNSHFNVFSSVVEVLAEEHQITFFSVHNLKRSHENITEKQVWNKYGDKRINFLENIINLNQYEQFLFILSFLNDKHFETMLTHNDISQLFESEEKFDLFITTNVISEPLFKFSHLFNVPLILLRNVYSWSYYEWIYLPRLEAVSQKIFPKNTPTIKEIMKKTEGIMVNTISIMGYSRPFAPNVIEIGGLHCNEPKPLPNDLEEFISGSGKNGVIYFSLGGTFSDKILSPKIKSIIINVFKRIPQKVLWKVDDIIEDLPSNVKISNWFPQQDILGHNKTKLFITQGGILSLQEAAYHGVQVLVLPILMDQLTNAHLVQNREYGKFIILDEFTEEKFFNHIQIMISNPKYKNNAELISAAIKDQPISIKTKVKHWINFIIRHRNNSLLKPALPDLSEIQLLEIDIYFTLFLSITFIFLFIIYVLYNILRIFNNIYKKINIVEKKML